MSSVGIDPCISERSDLFTIPIPGVAFPLLSTPGDAFLTCHTYTSPFFAIFRRVRGSKDVNPTCEFNFSLYYFLDDLTYGALIRLRYNI